jgi:hypothetical protein
LKVRVAAMPLELATYSWFCHEKSLTGMLFVFNLPSVSNTICGTPVVVVCVPVVSPVPSVVFTVPNVPV